MNPSADARAKTRSRPLWTRSVRLVGDLDADTARFWRLVVGVGLASGVVGALYVAALHGTTVLLGPDRWGPAAHIGVLAAVGGVIALLTRMAGDPGDVELLVDNIHVSGGRADARELRSLIPISLIGIGAGSAIGPEAPLVQTTGSVGSWLARRSGLALPDGRVLAITGMAAGFTVLFGTPLGAAVFALEILHRRGLEYYEALLPAAVGSLSGYGIYAAASGLGLQPVWHFAEPPLLEPIDLAVGVGAGVVGALAATVFVLTTRGLRMVFGRLPVLIRPAAGGAALGVLALWTPYALTFGELQIGQIAEREVVIGTLLVAAVAKLLAASTIVSAGWRGGFIVPLFFIGAALGSVAAELLGLDRVVAMAALMVAVNVGVTKTPFGSSIVVAEMAGIRLLPPVLAAAIIALFLTRKVAMIHSQRGRDTPAPSTTPPLEVTVSRGPRRDARRRVRAGESIVTVAGHDGGSAEPAGRPQTRGTGHEQPTSNPT